MLYTMLYTILYTILYEIEHLERPSGALSRKPLVSLSTPYGALVKALTLHTAFMEPLYKVA